MGGVVIHKEWAVTFFSFGRFRMVGEAIDKEWAAKSLISKRFQRMVGEVIDFKAFSRNGRQSH